MVLQRSLRTPRVGTRPWHAAIALAVLVGLVLQAVVTARAASSPPAHAVGTLAGAGLPTRVVRTLSFFTVQSNILCGAVSAWLALRPADLPRLRAVRLASLVGITVTGVVYSTVLARIHEPVGWAQHVNNTLFHYVVPVLVVLAWLLDPRPTFDGGTVARAAVWPVLWLAYTVVHGEVSGWYPYPFVDAATHGYARVTVNVLGVLVVFALVAAAFVLGGRRLAAGRGPGRVP